MTVALRRRTIAFAAATVAVIVAAAVVWHHLPTPSKVYRSFDVHGAVGETISGRLFEVTVTGLRAGQQVQTPRRPPVPALGEWVLVDAELRATREFVLPRAELLVGANTYVPSDRFALVQLGTELAPLISQQGSWAFDVDPTLLEPSTDLTLRVWSGDARFDTRLVVSMPFGDAMQESTPLILSPTRERA